MMQEEMRPVGEGFEDMAGSKRLPAARQVGNSKISYIVRRLKDEEAVLVSLTENIQRGDLREEEIVQAFLSLRESKPGQWTRSMFAERRGELPR